MERPRGATRKSFMQQLFTGGITLIPPGIDLLLLLLGLGIFAAGFHVHAQAKRHGEPPEDDRAGVHLE